MRGVGVVAGIAVGVCLAGQVMGFARDVTPQMEYGKTLKDSQSVAPTGDGTFGETINPLSGELRFSASDIVVKGIGPTIMLARTTKTQQHDESYDAPEFGNWDLSIPRIETMVKDNPNTTVPAGENWRVGISSTLARCTQFNSPTLSMDDWWHGYDFITEDGGRQMLLKRATENTQPMPSMRDASGNAMVFPALTLSNWQISCLPATANGQPGEAYLAISPDGTRYSLNYLVDAQADSVIENDPDANRIYRRFAKMMVTRIEDRFGNWVQYNYTGSQLTSVTAKDGREVAITWNSQYPIIQAITVMPGTALQRTWQYTYNLNVIGGTSTVIGASLASVVLPDGSKWTYAGSLGALNPPTHPQIADCTTRRGDQLSISSPTATSVVTAPSGAVGTFVRTPAWRARSYVTSTCYHDPVTNKSSETKPPLFGAYVLTQRTVTGPGLTPRTWTYAYPLAEASALRDACGQAGTCATDSFVDVRDPDGNRTRMTYSIRWGITEGKSLRTDVFQGESTLLSTTTQTYAAYDQGPWPTRIGISRLGGGTAIDKLERLTPVVSTTTVQQGRAFTSTVQAFDVFGRPTQVVKSSAPAP